MTQKRLIVMQMIDISYDQGITNRKNKTTKQIHNSLQ